MKKTKVSLVLVVAFVLAIALAGCTKEVIVEEPAPTEPAPAATTPAPADPAPATPAPAPSTSAPSPAAPAPATSDAEKLVHSIVDAAKEGKVIECSYAAQNNFDDVKKAWGEPDSDTYVHAASGSYATYTEKGVVFGYNNSMQIFEVRRVAGDVLEEMTLKDIKAVLGEPQYKSADAAYNPEYGYQISDDYKILFLMDEMGDASGVEHYNVIWPAGSANMMAGDLGNKW